MSVIKVENLSKSYEYYKKRPGLSGAILDLFGRQKFYKEAVKNISFEINEGELVGFLGPNGAGKTTTLKMLSGILYPSGGAAHVLGFVPWKRQKNYQKQIALVMGQKTQLWWDLPAYESLVLNKEIYEISDKKFNEQLEELVTLLGVKDLLNVQTRKLSLGERMKFELIASLIHSPKVLFLDEPTIGLDVVSQQKMREFIKNYNKEKQTTILLTSHYMEDVEALCKRVIIISGGTIIYDGDLEKLREKYVDHKILKITFRKPVTLYQLENFGKIKEYDKLRVVLEVPNEKVKSAASEILTALPVDDILIDEVPIEEIVRKIYQK
jgi:ABC-2 type transport system ATP-binding protein